jgi:type II secretory pathway predicted ATPase ExeA
MYKSFYSLSHTTFAKDTDCNIFFAGISYTEGMARLKYLKETQGIGVIYGEAGVGKIFLLRRFANTLNALLYKPIYFPLLTVTVNDFYRGLAFYSTSRWIPQTLLSSFYQSCLI